MNYYCLTIRKCTPCKTSKQAVRCFRDYEYMIKKIKDDYEDAHIEYHYECVEKKNGTYNIHLHGMIKTKCDQLYMSSRKGFSIRLELTKSRQAWLVYITKGPMKKRDILDHIICNELPPEPISDDDTLSSEREHNRELYKKKLFS